MSAGPMCSSAARRASSWRSGGTDHSLTRANTPPPFAALKGTHIMPRSTRVRGSRTLRESAYSKTCIAPVSSITDHRRLMYVAILCELSKHEVRDVLPRYSGGFVRISAEKDLVLTSGTLVSDPGWAHDHPL